MWVGTGRVCGFSSELSYSTCERVGRYSHITAPEFLYPVVGVT